MHIFVKKIKPVDPKYKVIIISNVLLFEELDNVIEIKNENFNYFLKD